MTLDPTNFLAISFLVGIKQNIQQLLEIMVTVEINPLKQRMKKFLGNGWYPLGFASALHVNLGGERGKK